MGLGLGFNALYRVSRLIYSSKLEELVFVWLVKHIPQSKHHKCFSERLIRVVQSRSRRVG